MIKSYIVFFVFLVFSATLKISHETAQQQAYSRMLKFVQSDPELTTALKNKQELNGEQLRKFSSFMIDDTFFQNQLIEAVTNDPQNNWIKQLPKKAQVRYLQIVTSVPFEKMNDDRVMASVVKRLSKDKQIGPALAKKYGGDLSSGDFLKTLQAEMGSTPYAQAIKLMVHRYVRKYRYRYKQ